MFTPSDAKDFRDEVYPNKNGGTICPTMDDDTLEWTVTVASNHPRHGSWLFTGLTVHGVCKLLNGQVRRN